MFNCNIFSSTTQVATFVKRTIYRFVASDFCILWHKSVTTHVRVTLRTSAKKNIQHTRCSTSFFSSCTERLDISDLNRCIVIKHLHTTFFPGTPRDFPTRCISTSRTNKLILEGGFFSQFMQN